MFRLDTEKDIELLRQAALLLESENKRLTAQVVELTRELLVAKGKDKEQLQLRSIQLEQQLAAQNKKLFGESSEKRADGQADSAGDEEKAADGTRPDRAAELARSRGRA